MFTARLESALGELRETEPEVADLVALVVALVQAEDSNDKATSMALEPIVLEKINLILDEDGDCVGFGDEDNCCGSCGCGCEEEDADWDEFDNDDDDMDIFDDDEELPEDGVGFGDEEEPDKNGWA